MKKHLPSASNGILKAVYEIPKRFDPSTIDKYLKEEVKKL